jgi:hypothetical protein
VDAFGNALGSSLAGASSGTLATQTGDALGDFIDKNMSAWEQRQANFDQIVRVFGQAGSGSRYLGVQVAGGERDEHIARMLRLAKEPAAGGTTVRDGLQPDGSYRVTIIGTADTPQPVGVGNGASMGDGSSDRWYPNSNGLGGTVVGGRLTPEEIAEIDAQAFEAAREGFRGSEIEKSNSYAQTTNPLPAGWNMRDASRQSFERDRQARLANSPSMTAWVPGPSVVDRLNQTAAVIDSIGRNPGGAAGYIVGRSLGMRPQDAAVMAAIGATTGELLSLRAGVRTGKNTDVEGYVSSLYRKTTPTGTPAGLFEVEHAGKHNYRILGGGTAIDIDGYRGQTILEAKHVGDVARSPYVPNSNIPSFLRDKILKEQQYEFQRLQSVINDPTVPFTRVEVLTNHNGAVPYFRELMDRYQVPGVVRVVPTEVPPTWPRTP